MRLFIAIKFDEEILDTLTDFQNELKRQGVKGNYTSRENLHITLAFIGDYGNPEDVLDAMEQLNFRPLDISLDGVGTFGDIFWAGLADNPQLAAVVKRLRRELSDYGIPFDKKRFSPHVTLIRKYSCVSGKEIQVSDPTKGRMKVNRISLMRSERGRNGMIYAEIGSVGR